MKSIKTKLIIYFSAVLLLASAALGFISIQDATRALTEDTEKALFSMAADAARLTESRVQIQMRTLEMIALNDGIQSMDWDVQRSILKKQLPRTGFLDIGVVLPDGTARYSDGSTSQLGDREYVKKAFAGEANVSDLLLSRVTNQMVLMYAVPIEKDGKVAGVLVGRRDWSALTSITDGSGFGENGYAYMINGKGTVVAHPDKERVLNQWNPIEEVKNDESQRSVADEFELILREREGVSSYSFSGRQLYNAFKPVEGTDWIIVVTANKSEVLSSIPELRRSILITATVILLIGIALIYFIGNQIAKPVIEAAKHSERIAALDITEDIPEENLKKEDEVGKLSVAIQTITDSLRSIIGEISNSAEQVAAASEELTASAQQTSTTADDVARAVEEIARGASEQAESVQKGTVKAALLGDAIEKDLSYVKSLNTASYKVKDVVRDGIDEIDELTRITEESNNAAKEIYDVILKTYDSSEKIGQASSVIASIADQTNMLALNAAIEAARAGESGKGFAVVADEIKKLAEQSAESTKEIGKIVNELRNNAQNAVQTMNRVAVIVGKQAESVTMSRDKYMLIAQAMNEAIRVVEQLTVSGQDIGRLKNEILDSLQSLSAIAEENSASTEQMSASIEEQTAAVEEIANASEGLSELAQGLQSIVKRFRLNPR